MSISFEINRTKTMNLPIYENGRLLRYSTEEDLLEIQKNVFRIIAFNKITEEVEFIIDGDDLENEHNSTSVDLNSDNIKVIVESKIHDRHVKILCGYDKKPYYI